MIQVKVFDEQHEDDLTDSLIHPGDKLILIKEIREQP